MKRILLGVLVALGLSVGMAAADPPPKPAPKPEPTTIVVPWCEINPFDILCWFWP